MSLIAFAMSAAIARAEYKVDPVVEQCLKTARQYAQNRHENFGSSPEVLRVYLNYCTVRTVQTCDEPSYGGYSMDYNVDLASWTVDSVSSDGCSSRP